MARSARLAVIVVALTLALQAPATGAPGTTAEPSFVTNGDVHKVLRTPNRTFLGGTFDYIGPPTGFGTVLNFGGSVDASYPVVNGPVNASTQDGAGGFFIGGEFTRVGGSNRDGLAHILQDGTVDPNFNPDFTYTGADGIRSLSRSGTDLFVAGQFSHVNATAQGSVAKLSTADGSLTAAWNPSVGGVNEILAANSRVYLGGTFTTVDSTARLRVAAVNQTNGDLDTGFVANLDSPETKEAEALLIASSSLYIAGAFETVNGTTRPGVAKVNQTTGALDTTFASGVTGLNRFRSYPSLAANNTNLFVGDRNQVHSFNLNTGVRDSAFQVSLDDSQFASADALQVNGSNLLIGGDFTRVNDTSRLRFASVNTSDGAVNNNTVQTYSEAPVTITLPNSATGGKLFVGGDFTSAGGVERRSVAALDASGDLDPAFENNRFGTGFSDNQPPAIAAMAFGNGRLYIGGEIREVDGEDRFGAFALNPATGAIDESFNGATSGDGGGQINDLELRDGRLYAAGRFEEIGGVARNDIAALNPDTGVPIDGWAPNPRHVSNFDDVADFAIHGQRMYIAGRFDTVGGQAHDAVAALDLQTGAVDPAFDLDIDTTQTQPLRSIAADGNRVYFGGSFNAVNGFPRGNIAAVTAATGDTVTGWNVTSSATVDDIALGGDRVFLAGFFREINGTDRRGFAAVARTNGALDPWNPLVASPPDFNVLGIGISIAIAHGRIDMGGNFNRVDARPRSGFISVSTPMPVNTSPPSVSGTASEGQVLTCSPGTWSNAPSFAFEWLRDGQPIADATASTYTLVAADAGHQVACRVTASNSDGSAELASAAIAVEPPPTPPTPPSPPAGGDQPGGDPPPTGDAGPPLGATPAAARIAGSKATLKKGVISLKLSCPAGGEDCAGKVTVTTSNRKRTKLGSERFDIPDGNTAKVEITVPRRLRDQANKLKKIRVVAGDATKTLPLEVKR